ncbi:hypothetical protein FL966_09920 [Caproiciproducens galactitolivorans]|uniref:Uncharacterized protein n=1 Tax=Caproiciproducens galactitolivorans TaxID=642589 RepID=A0A4Z0YHA6_9FIRM|nr:hypothetical protein FL966_09920 [Caproiciproducens galactitolivorans]TGJ77036.1 hypothetical protein CAGA_11110 [Caproiciproducens galactitolivorans]
MKVVDLRNVFANCNDMLIEISDNYIYYAEEKKEEGHNSLFILEYNRVTRRERIVTNYILSNPSFVQHFFCFPDHIIIVMESGESEAWILRIDKHTGEEKTMAKLNFLGSFLDCTALDEDHLILYTVENEKHQNMFRAYKKLTGFSKISYLYDLDEEKYYYVRDPRICNADSMGLIPFTRDGEVQLLVLLPHGDEAEKEKCYKNRRWLGDNVNDNVWLCPLFDFIIAVKNGEERAPLELILSAGTCGLVRYAGMDPENLYFRAKYFPTGDQRLCAYNKMTGKKTVAAELNLKGDEKPASFYIDVNGARVYRITEDEDNYEVDGVLNSEIHAKYSKELGEFLACVDDRFILARYILSDEKDSFEFNSIYDVQTGEQKSYECRCAFQGSTVVLY